ncbi:TetR/AcrR family transcriptional regulator [Notoacmeibacter sp. MSK16QG-6]|uniref:TetR/AcrR family transcriptional regulator n=1 Tax=Notoacmeibacter sp. MSK16QG-6 TaxID=2957982 RepID=UPI0020A15234|nr:TetR/AcrR family transcriptional regulator [Notoacmeibacter sp. MSK16QG-6]MCP1200418.1 TetR/AcrR family transcriptional regulator [Notoacmeibacter sp. MSK16QG-6]
MARAKAADHEEKRGAILRTAAAAFAEHGYDATSMRDLATACGVSKALIYHYYPSKEVLLSDVIGEHLEALLTAIGEVPYDLEPTARLRAATATILENYQEADSEHKLQLNALSRLPVEDQKRLRQLQRQIVEKMEKVIIALAPERFEAEPTLLRPVTMSLFGMLNWFYLWKRGGGISREDYANMVADLFIGGLDNAIEGQTVSAHPAGLTESVRQ